MNNNQFFFQKDFQKDLWSWMQIYSTIKDHQVLENDPLLDKIQTQIIQDQNAGMAYFFSLHFPYKMHLMQQVILNSQSPKYSFAFASSHPAASFHALEEIVLHSDNIKYICYFGLCVPQSNRRKIEKLIIQSNQAKYAYLWLKDHQPINFKQIKQILLGSNKPQYLLEVAKHSSSSKEIKQLEDQIIQLGSLTYIRMFAAEIEKADIEKLEQAVLASGNIKEIKKFAKLIKGSKISKFRILL